MDHLKFVQPRTGLSETPGGSGLGISGLQVAQTWAIQSPEACSRPTVMPGAPHLQALLVYSIVKYQLSEYGSYRFPAWAELLGILMGLLSCLMIPAGMLVAVLREEGSLWEVSLPNPCLPPAFLTCGPAPGLPGVRGDSCCNTLSSSVQLPFALRNSFSNWPPEL